MTRVRAWLGATSSLLARWAAAAIPDRAAFRRRIATQPLMGGVAAVAVISALVIAATAGPSSGPTPQWLSAEPAPTPGTLPDPPLAHPRLQSVAVPVEISPPPAPPVRTPVNLPSEVPPPPDPLPPPPPVPAGDFAGWAVMNTATGSISGSGDLHRTSTTASMIKAWLVADYLRRAAQQGEQPPPDKMDELSQIIRDSNNEYTQTLYAELGYHSSIDRLVSMCGLTDSRAIPYYWSNTELSPRDTARMGACLADGRAAGGWTEWLLREMRLVRGLGDFGIRWAFPVDQRGSIAIKNGWVTRPTGEYHVNCLAIGDGWTMGVMTRYPAHLGYQHGAEICRSLAERYLLDG